MKPTILAVTCLLALPLMAQNRSRVVIPPGMPGVQPQQQGEETQALGKNITIRLHGTTTTGADVDLSLSGIGPRFRAEQVVNDGATLICEYLVSGTETGYRVSYTVSSRIRVTTQSGPAATNYEYRDIGISGTVLCSANEAQELVRNGTKPLNLTVTEDAAPDAE